jgi:hypothetical protein
MDQQPTASKSKWVWIALIIIVLAVAGVAIWYFTKNDKTSSPTSQNSTQKVYTPKNADWAVYKSAKFGYNLSHPKDYVLAETGDKSINLTKGDKIKVEMYYSSADVNSAVALYTDESKGYMTGGKAESVTIAGTTGKKVTGTFGKFGGNRMAFDGIKGSTTIFKVKEWTFFLNSYDNADVAALGIFNDIAADLKF